MRPGSLLKSCCQSIARNLIKAIKHLSISDSSDQGNLIEYLIYFNEWYGDIVYANITMQDQLYKHLIAGIRRHYNPAVHVISMLMLCPKVTIDQVALMNESDYSPANTGRDISVDECEAMMAIISKMKSKRTLPGHPSKEHFSLPTTSLVLEGIYFHDIDFLPKLLKDMPRLLHFEIQYNGTPSLLRALSKHCRLLESLSFLEPRREVAILEADIVPILFDVPPEALTIDTGLITKFIVDEHFRSLFKVQFPNLRKLNIDELYLEEDFLHDIYTLVMVLHPKLNGFGKHTGLTKKMLSKFRRAWEAKYGESPNNIELFLTKAKFIDSVYSSRVITEMELNYFESVVPMFKTLKSIEVHKDNLNQELLGRFCLMFAQQVEAFSLSVLPSPHISAFSSVKHLRLSSNHRYCFDQVHFILDHCVHLQTLSIHGVLVEDSPHVPPLNNGGLLEEEENILENLLIEELANHVHDFEAFIEGPHGDIHLPDLNAAAAAAVHRPRPFRSSFKYKESKIHSKLLTLRIASLLEAGKQPSEDFIRSLLERLPNLRNLCLGMWMGALSMHRQLLTCTGNALVGVVAQRRIDQPLLAELEQLCCLPSGNESDMRSSLVCLAEKLPSLHTIVIPALDSFTLSPILKSFQNSHIEIRHKCATDQVFTYWEPDH